MLTSIASSFIVVTISTTIGPLTRQVITHSLKSILSYTKTIGIITMTSFRCTVLSIRRFASAYY
jgi:hypothetical protein